MNQRLVEPPESSAAEPAWSAPTSACAALAALSPLAARTILRCCAAWDLLECDTQAALLRRVSSGPAAEAGAVRAALSALMQSTEWKAGRLAQKAGLERLAAVTSLPTWFARGTDSAGPH